MASIESKLFYLLLRLINKKKFLEMQFAFGKFDFNNSKEPPKVTNSACTIRKREVNGRSVFRLTPRAGMSKKHILYVHGGAYVQNFVKQHWKFLFMLVKSTQCTITAPDYPLAPNHTYIDAFKMLIPLYQEAIAEAGPENTIVMGDSAGGGLALALCQQLKIDMIPQPRRIVLLSPWLDVALKNPEIDLIDPCDPFLSVPGLRKAGLAYARGADIGNFMLSPINGPLEGLGDISVFIGTKDILAADARKLCVLAEKKGVFIDYREYKDMVHVWMLLYFRESRQAQEEIKQLIVDL
jgi:acetyl esterase/lipase